ncbi:hypothetical protein Tco_0309198 [Tanacetum coccineum]
MESEKYLEGQSMQRPPLFESDGFIYWKNRFETYVKSKDLDLWHVITDGDFPPIQNNPETKKDEIVPFHKQNDDLKKKLAKNNEAKMVIYNALPRKEYERIFMCQTAKEILEFRIRMAMKVAGNAVMLRSKKQLEFIGFILVVNWRYYLEMGEEGDDEMRERREKRERGEGGTGGEGGWEERGRAGTQRSERGEGLWK